ncbi:hypothetical protein B0H14DRAFT_3612122 [Mycena olivaceomarginata]|nr:hypothetical protein B0H14DRAFT_3612122 [Mycena olivaceomarginata]
MLFAEVIRQLPVTVRSRITRSRIPGHPHFPHDLIQLWEDHSFVSKVARERSWPKAVPNLEFDGIYRKFFTQHPDLLVVCRALTVYDNDTPIVFPLILDLYGLTYRVLQPHVRFPELDNSDFGLREFLADHRRAGVCYRDPQAVAEDTMRRWIHLAKEVIGGRSDFWPHCLSTSLPFAINLKLPRIETLIPGVFREELLSHLKSNSLGQVSQLRLMRSVVEKKFIFGFVTESRVSVSEFERVQWFCGFFTYFNTPDDVNNGIDTDLEAVERKEHIPLFLDLEAKCSEAREYHTVTGLVWWQHLTAHCTEVHMGCQNKSKKPEKVEREPAVELPRRVMRDVLLDISPSLLLCQGIHHFILAQSARTNFWNVQEAGGGDRSLEPTIYAWARSWDASVYASLRQFHQAKGFNPDNQNVARHLRAPLFQLSSEVDPPFAHVDSDEPGSEEETDQPESSSLHDDLLVSKSFKFFMNVQLSFILFLAFFWLYDHGWYRPQPE